jgi:hypothetical protein
MADAQTCEVGATLVPLNIEFRNNSTATITTTTTTATTTTTTNGNIVCSIFTFRNNNKFLTPAGLACMTIYACAQ